MAGENLASLLGEPEIGLVPTKLTNASCPKYLVPPADLRLSSQCLESVEIRLTDFGEAFEGVCKAGKSNTPLSLRAPETFFESDWGSRIDLWSASCAVSSISPLLTVEKAVILNLLPDFRAPRVAAPT